VRQNALRIRMASVKPTSREMTSSASPPEREQPIRLAKSAPANKEIDNSDFRFMATRGSGRVRP